MHDITSRAAVAAHELRTKMQGPIALPGDAD